MMDRRTFLQLSGLVGCGLFAPRLWAETPKSATQATKTLILVELKGGNDGLNTLIPYADELYYQHRPKLAIPEKEIITLDQKVGMHPALTPLQPLWEAKNMAWIQGVGYANPIRSHFRAIDIWDSASTEDTEVSTGWVAKTLTTEGLKGVAVDCSLGPLYSSDLSTIGLVNPKQFARLGKKLEGIKAESAINPALQHVLEVQNSVDTLAQRFLSKINTAPVPTIAFPTHRFGKSLESVYGLMSAGLNIPTYKVSLTGFDTHANQLPRHANLLKTLAESLTILVDNLKASNQWDNTLIMTYSEFGRRLQENASGGTDHGTAAPQLVLGGVVKGGIYGTYPALDQLDQRGDPIFTTDFRDIYNTIETQWWQQPSDTSKTLKFI
ncbi:DUF1501 domain-containing protein [Thiothrix caldifontis]|nr:DUF1501 domain-containing protein [Thiothrix caldifontis]